MLLIEIAIATLTGLALLTGGWLVIARAIVHSA